MHAVREQLRAEVLTLTIDDPENRNALRPAILEGLLQGLERAAGDGVRAVVVTNTGPVFCAGADLRHASDAVAVATGPRGLVAVLDAIASCPVPVVGRIDGAAVGGGLGLVAAMDISVARDDARFGFPEVRLGAIPAVIAPVCLPKMGRADALEAFLRGHRFPATEAAAMGLINHAVPAERLDAVVGSIVADVLLGGPQAVAEAKHLVRSFGGSRPLDASALAARSAELFAGPEAREGVAAFLERRRPSWARP